MNPFESNPKPTKKTTYNPLVQAVTRKYVRHALASATEIGVWRRRHTSSRTCSTHRDARRRRRGRRRRPAPETMQKTSNGAKQQPNISQIKYNIIPEHHDDCDVAAVVDCVARRRRRSLCRPGSDGLRWARPGRPGLAGLVLLVRTEAPKFNANGDDVERATTSCTIARARSHTRAHSRSSARVRMCGCAGVFFVRCQRSRACS